MAYLLRYLIVIPKAIAFLIHLLAGLLIAVGSQLLLGKQWYARPAGRFIKLSWVRILACILNLKIRRHGTISDKPVVFVANHISWLDVVALGSDRGCAFVAKNSVKRWPLIGAVAGLSGTLFINREDKKDVAKTLARSNQLVAKGVSLAFFPEATTTNGKILKPFKTSLYQTAINSARNIQAVAIRYPSCLSKKSPAPYIGDETFLMHLLKVLATPRIDVTLTYCKPIVVDAEYSRKQLAETTQMQVAKILALAETL